MSVTAQREQTRDARHAEGTTHRKGRGSRSHRSHAVIALLLPMLTVACSADDFLVGGKTVNGPPMAPVATYRIDACTNAQDGSPTALPQPLSYYLVASPDGRFVLHELDASGSGAAIDNYWAEGDKDLWAVRIRMISTAMTFELPRDRSLPGTRRVYQSGGFEATTVAGGLRITGTPSAVCVMTPTGSSAAAAETAKPAASGCQTDRDCKRGRTCDAGSCVRAQEPSPDPAEPAPVAGGCQSDGECKGHRVCHNGTCVAPPKRPAPHEQPPAASGGCENDSECKGERVCRNGVCESPAPTSCKRDTNCPGDEICVASRCQLP